MKSFQRRNPIPIGAIGLVVLLLGFIAAMNADDLPIIGGGTTYTAEFSEAAGLKADDSVRIAGVKVGSVESIDLAGDRVQVAFKVDDAWIGDRTSAAIKIQTLLGQKYIALTPRGKQALDPNAAIPLERTTAPYDVMEAFRGLSNTVDEIDTQQLAKSFDVLSQTFANTPDEVSSALSGLSRLSETIAKRDDQLASLLANTKQVSKTLDNRDAALVKLLEDGSKLLGELQQRKDAIHSLLVGSQELAKQLKGLVQDNNEQLAPVLAELDRLTSMLYRNQDALAEGIKRYAPFIRLFNNAIGNGRWFDNYICGLILPSLGPVNQEGCNAQ